MAGFSDQPFSARINALGDESEGVFADVYPEKFEEFGWRRPSFYMGDMPPLLRYVPDFATAKGLVECLGVGHDETLKLKVEKHGALRTWHSLWRTDYFIWSSKRKMYCWVRVPDMTRTATSAVVKHFPEGKAYYAIKVSDLPLCSPWRVR